METSKTSFGQRLRNEIYIHMSHGPDWHLRGWSTWWNHRWGWSKWWKCAHCHCRCPSCAHCHRLWPSQDLPITGKVWAAPGSALALAKHTSTGSAGQVFDESGGEAVSFWALLSDQRRWCAGQQLQSASLVFLYQLRGGACPCSYGLQVAQLAGIPRSITVSARRAGSVLESRLQVPHWSLS